jgi:hypothetical protein
MRRPISDPVVAQLLSTAKPATGAPVHDAFPHCTPPLAHASTR